MRYVEASLQSAVSWPVAEGWVRHAQAGGFRDGHVVGHPLTGRPVGDLEQQNMDTLLLSRMTDRKGVDVLTEYVAKLLHQSRRSAGYARPRPGRIVRCGIRGVFKGERGLSGTLCI